MYVGGSTSIEHWTSIPDEDHGPLMTGCVWGLWAFSGLFLGLRLYIRLYHRGIWYDDAFLTLVWVCSPASTSTDSKIANTIVPQLSLSVECVLNQMAISLGFGKQALDSKSSTPCL